VPVMGEDSPVTKGDFRQFANDLNRRMDVLCSDVKVLAENHAVFNQRCSDNIKMLFEHDTDINGPPGNNSRPGLKGRVLENTRFRERFMWWIVFAGKYVAAPALVAVVAAVLALWVR
jgi:hypothetical protein